MQQSSNSSSNYYQYYQQTPNTDPQPDPSYAAVLASAPPSDHYQFPDPLPYSFPHLNNNNNNNNNNSNNNNINSQYYPYDQTPNYENTPIPNPNYALYAGRAAGNYDYTPGLNPNPNSAFSDYDRNNRAAVNYDYAPGPNPNSNPNPAFLDYDRNNQASGNYDYAPGPNPNSAFLDYDRNNRAAGNYNYAPGLNQNLNPNPNQAFLDYDGNNRVAGNYDKVPGFDSVNNYDPGLYGEGLYAYSGGKKGNGSGSIKCSGVVFDDYGRAIVGGNDGKGNGSRVANAGLKAEVAKNDDVAGGVEKFRARMLSEGAGQTEMDVLCQIGLDGIKILDPATSRILKIYPLESVTRWEVLDSYIFAFWANTTIDMESKRIRLKSNRYTSNNMLDMVTAASFQLKEIGETKKPYDAVKASEQASEKKKGFPDWMNLMKPRNEEKEYWVPDEAVTKCTACGTDFNAFNRRHHCRNCGDIFCDKCTQGRIELTTDENDVPVRVCDRCMAEVTQRLANVKESAGKVATLQSHADLAKKLKEQMEKNRKTSTGSTSSGSGMRMKDVACPTCTVHLQVQVPSSGSETIECSVCQHPFLVHA